jgi:hypothetical protein
MIRLTYMGDNEVWLQINDYDNYEVSNIGNVRNKKTGRILRPANKGGYLIIGLYKNSKSKIFQVHRLVTSAFIPNPENKPQINHLDKNRSNNNIENLQWTTALENNIHRSLGVIQTTNQNVSIWRINRDTNEKLQLYNSILEAAQWLLNNNCSITSSLHNLHSNISCAVRGVYKTCCGFKWMVKEQIHLENEEWRNIKIDDNILHNYFVSNLGRFKNSKGIIMENYKPHHSGYICVKIDNKKYALHRLVAFVFIDNVENKPFVNHLDGNKTNNCVNNLQWCSVLENNLHAINNNLKKFYTRKIAQYDSNNILIKEYNSIVQAMNETNIKSIKEVLYGNQKTAGGFIWKYLD